MSIATRFRILTSLGLGAVFAIGGAIVAWLVVQAALLFTWPVIVALFVGGAVTAFVIDVITERPAE